MKRATFDKLLKIVDRLTDPNDGTALAALRAANRLLAEDGATWVRVFQRIESVDIEAAPVERPVAQSVSKVRAPTPPTSPPVSPGASIKSYIDDMFETVYLRQLSNDATEFIDSLHEQWVANRSLSPRQIESLEKFMPRDRG